MPDVPPPSLRFYRPKKYLSQLSDLVNEKLGIIEHETVDVHIHRMSGCSVEYAYWPNSWMNSWGVEEILKWEGRPLQPNQYYADYIIAPQKEIVIAELIDD